MCLNQQTNEQNCTLFIYKMSLCFTEKGDMYNACGGGLLPKNRNVKSWPSLPGGAGECVVQTHLCRLCVCVIQVWLTLQPHAVLSGSLEHCRWPDLLMSIHLINKPRGQWSSTERGYSHVLAPSLLWDASSPTNYFTHRRGFWMSGLCSTW